MKWSETENIVWKTELPAWSGSSPIVWGDRIFLTSPEKGTGEPGQDQSSEPGNNGKTGGRDPGGPVVLLFCFERATGKELWRREAGKGNHLERKHNMASPSPVTDGERIWTMTGNGEFAAFDFTGKELWRRNIQNDFSKFGQMFGYASSPLVYKDRVILAVLHGYKTDEDSYLLAVDKLTGKAIWRTVRPTDGESETPDAYASPILVTNEGRTDVVISGGAAVTGHDPISGREVWRVSGLNPEKSPWYRTISTCTTADGIIFAPTRVKPFHAIAAGGEGDVTSTKVLWKSNRGPDVPTAVTDGKRLWIVEDQGIVDCLDARTGETAYPPQRVAAGTYSSSPILADGKIYITSETATTTVLEAGSEFKVLAVNQLDDGYTLATPAIAGNRIYFRSSTHLYCIGEK